MKLKTSKGKTFEVDWVLSFSRDSSKVMIEYHDARPLAEIAADFDGLESFTHNERVGLGAWHTLKGFTELVGITRDAGTDYVRLTLYKGEK